MALDVLQHDDMQTVLERLALVEKERDELRRLHFENAERLHSLADGKTVSAFWLDILASHKKSLPSVYSVLLHKEQKSDEWSLVYQDDVNNLLLSAGTHVTSLPKTVATFANSPSCPMRVEEKIDASDDWHIWQPFLQKHGFGHVLMLSIVTKKDVDYLLVAFQKDLAEADQNTVELLLKDAATLIKAAVIREQADHQLLEESHYDSKTGLLRRYSFENNFSLILKDARRHFLRLALISLRLKANTETYDYKRMKAIGEIIQSTVRDNDLVAYYGEGEFITGVRIRNMQDAEVVANKLIKALRFPEIESERLVHSGVSIGVAYYPEHSTLNDLYRAASFAANSVPTEFGYRIEFHGSVYTTSAEFYTF